jgi:hypothetical protein
VEGAADAVALELGHLQAFMHDPLAGEGGIAVEEDAHDPGALDIALLPLLRPDLAHDDGVHGLEVRRVGGEREMHLAAVGQDPVGRGAEVILDVARAQDVVAAGRTLELAEDRGIGLAHDVGEHVEPAAMRHAEDDLVDAELGTPADHGLHGGNRTLAAVEPEPLGARELDVEELLEALGLGQMLEDRPLLLGIGVEEAAGVLDPLLQPALLVRFLDMEEFYADGRAVGLLQDLHHLAQRRRLEPEHEVEIEGAVEIGVGEAVGVVVELGVVLLAAQAQGVELGDQVAAHAIGPDQHDQPEMIADLALVASSSSPPATGGRFRLAARRTRPGVAGALPGHGRRAPGRRARACRNRRASSAPRFPNPLGSGHRAPR